MPIQRIEFAWMFAESSSGATEVATETVNFPSQSVFAQASITTIQTTHAPGLRQSSMIMRWGRRSARRLALVTGIW